MRRQGSEYAPVYAHFSQHAPAFDTHQRHVIYHRNGFKPLAGAFPCYGSAFALRIERVENADRDAFFD